MWMSILNWVIFLVICVLDVVGNIILCFKQNEGNWNFAKFIGAFLGIIARLYVLYILLTHWLLI